MPSDELPLNGRDQERVRHPLLAGLSSGIFFSAFLWGFLHFPFWFGMVNGIGIAVVIWLGYRRPDTWLRRLNATGTTRRTPGTDPRFGTKVWHWLAILFFVVLVVALVVKELVS